MKKITSLLLLLSACVLVVAGETRVSSKESVMVNAPDSWVTEKSRPPSGAFPFETYGLTPPTNRNALLLISVLGKDDRKFTNAPFLKTILRGDCRPYVNSVEDLKTVEIKEVTITNGFGFCANFVDPDLVGKPVIPGSYKTATPVILSLGSNYLIKATILCDDLKGVDYQEAFKIVQSIHSKGKAPGTEARVTLPESDVTIASALKPVNER